MHTLLDGEMTKVGYLSTPELMRVMERTTSTTVTQATVQAAYAEFKRRIKDISQAEVERLSTSTNSLLSQAALAELRRRLDPEDCDAVEV
jgi:hypothetical protein